MKKYIVTKGIAAGLLTAPTAHITTNKSRKKIHTGNQVYLKSEENFEFELFNPTTNTVLAKIKLNGKEISSSGIVIKSGQRIFLDRFLDSPNKFKFETYEVNGNNADVQKAISLNGNVEVNFYNEKIVYPVHNPYTITYGGTYTTPTYYNYGDIPLVGTCVNNTTFTAANYNKLASNLQGRTTSLSTTDSGTYTLTSSSVNSMQSQKLVDLDSLNPNLRSTLKKTVTGTVEKGEKSNQEFEYVNKDFNYYVNNVVKYKILPFENKPVEVAEIKKTKNFCEVCGFKLSENANFCGDCGKKV